MRGKAENIYVILAGPAGVLRQFGTNPFDLRVQCGLCMWESGRSRQTTLATPRATARTNLSMRRTEYEPLTGHVFLLHPNYPRLMNIMKHNFMILFTNLR